MKMKLTVCGLILGAALFSQTAFAEEAPPAVYQTADGVLSVMAPAEDWKVLEDPNYWFAMSDGDDLITISHLSNGEALPAVEVANDHFAGVCQAYVSTQNEVFVVKGASVKAEDLTDIMKAIGTVRVLKYDTKTAIAKDAQPQASAFGIRQIGELYYVTAEHLNVRTGCSTNDPVIGDLTKGTEVTVKGAVTKDGADYGWYQIRYNGDSAYVSADFLSKTKPSETPAPTEAPEQKTDSADYLTDSIPVYAEDGSIVYIFPVGDMFEDYTGLKYSNVRGDLYVDIVNDVQYSADPSYWVNGEPQPDDEAETPEPFTVYAEDGSTVEIFWTGGMLEDYKGLQYSNVRGDMYYDVTNEILYSADPTYWYQNEEAGTDDEENDADEYEYEYDNEYDAGDADDTGDALYDDEDTQYDEDDTLYADDEYEYGYDDDEAAG